MTCNVASDWETREAIKKAVRAGLDGLRAEPRVPLSDWAAENFKMAGESSHQKGDWTAWALQVGIMDFMSDDRIEELYVMKSKRVGYTKMLTAFIAYSIAHLRRNLALWQPTDDDRDSYVKSEIDPVLDQIDAVMRMRKVGKGREDTIKLKQFLNSAVHLLGAKAARAFRRITVAIALLDEWDAMDQTVEKAGPPDGLAKGRLEGAPYPKFIGGTTPRVKGLSHVERAIGNADGLVRFYIECPHCQADHPLMWGGKKSAFGFKWTRGEPETVHHVCPHCLGVTRQADYLKGGMPAAGVWLCEKTGKRYGRDRQWRTDRGVKCRPPKTLGVQVWSAYSPQRSWESIVKEFEEAVAALEKGDVGPMQLFVNETLGETWEIKGERSDEHVLQERAKEEVFTLGLVPKGGLVLTAGIDVQRDRWEIAVWAWARGLESWTVDHHIIEGNPANDEDWLPVTTYLQRRYTQEWHGGSMGISAVSIDASDQTQSVYNWVRKNQFVIPKLAAIKGSSEEYKPILGAASSQEVNWRGQKFSGVHGVKLWMVGVDTAKDLLLGQLGIEKPGPGFVHMSPELPREWYEQLTAEQRVLMKSNGKDVFKWVPRRKRNEVLDCRNYALHGAYRLGLHSKKESYWTQLETVMQPAQDLFSAPIVVAPDSADSNSNFQTEPYVKQPTKRTNNHAGAASDDGWTFDRRG